MRLLFLVLISATVCTANFYFPEDLEAQETKENGLKKYSAKYLASGQNSKLGGEKKTYHEDKKHGISDKEVKKANFVKKGGKELQNYDSGKQSSKYKKGKKSHKAAKFGEKKGHKKGHKTKGYHNTFHKDEYYKEHRFYDDAHHSGYFDKNGNALSYYQRHLQLLNNLRNANTAKNAPQVAQYKHIPR